MYLKIKKFLKLYFIFPLLTTSCQANIAKKPPKKNIASEVTKNLFTYIFTYSGGLKNSFINEYG